VHFILNNNFDKQKKCKTSTSLGTDITQALSLEQLHIRVPQNLIKVVEPQ